MSPRVSTRSSDGMAAGYGVRTRGADGRAARLTVVRLGGDRRQEHQGEEHPGRVGEGDPGRPESRGGRRSRWRRRCRSSVRRQQPERRAAEFGRRQACHGSVLGRLDKPIPIPADEGEGQDAPRAGGEAGIGGPNSPRPGSGPDGATPVPEMPGRDADQRRGGVVGDVEPEGDQHGPVVVAAFVEQLGGPEDQQRRGDVAELEGRPRSSAAQRPFITGRSAAGA